MFFWSVSLFVQISPFSCHFFRIREFTVTDRSSVTSLGQGSYVRGLLYIRNSYVWSLWHLLIYIWFSCFFSLILWKYGWRIALVYWWDRQCILIPIFILIPCLFESLFSTESEICKLPTRVRQSGIEFAETNGAWNLDIRTGVHKYRVGVFATFWEEKVN